MAAVWNVFDKAVRVLVGAGPIKQRLSEAWRDHLAPLQDKDLPEPLRGRLATLRHAMHSAQPTGGMTAAEVSVRKMSEKEAADHAVRILEIYGQLAASDSDAGTPPRLRVVAPSHERESDVERDSFDELPAFLSRA
jgi:hypothetical protein